MNLIGDGSRPVVEESLVVFEDSKKMLFEAKQYIKVRKPYVFLWNECITLPANTLRVLIELYERYPKAGFVSGHFVEFPVNYFVEDIYNPKVMNQWDKENLKAHSKVNGVVEVDTITPYGMLTKTEHFLNYFSDKGDSTNSLSYGIKLRQMGYTNYVGTRLTYKYGEK